MTRTHEIKLDGYGAHTTLAEDRPIMLLGTAESYGIEMLHIAPGKDWEGLTITATFNAADGTSTDMLMGPDGNIAVPTEATAKSGSGRIVFTGVSNGIQRISCDLDYFVVAHSAINGTQSGGTAPSWFEQAANRFLPLGGTTGQVLAKKTDADFEAEWQDSKGGEGGITPTIGDNGNWFLGDTDTGKPSRGKDGKSAYSYAQEGGYTGTEEEFAAKLAAEKLPNPHPLTFTGAVNETYDGSSAKTITIPSGGAHSDWNQNDSTAADYIKNRPFYTGDPVETVLVEERTVPFVKIENGLYMTEFESTFAPTVGETYKVSWDGTVYECTCVGFNRQLAIGNLSIAGAGSDTGEPFLMEIYGGKGMNIGTSDTSASHTISISEFVSEVVKIDEMYIPYNIARTSDVDEKLANCIKTVNGTAPDASGNVEVQTISEDVLSADQYGNAIIVKSGVVFKKRLHRYSALVIGKPNVALLVKEGKTSNVEDTVFAFSAANNDGNSVDSIRLSRNGIEFISENVVISSKGSANTFPDVIRLNSSTSHGVMVEITKDACFVLPSSTKGSTKKFKITVDDSGTITATEVV